MKRVIWAVIAVGFLVVSCGGNIKKVQNGVFSNYDNTITIGKALENNKFLKGGKWKAIEMNGRDYVTYTVKLTRSQAEEIMTASLPRYYENYADQNKPNYVTARAFYNILRRWSGDAGNAERLAKWTSMSGEEVNQAIDIFKVKLDTYKEPREAEFYNYSGIIEKIGESKLNDDFLDPYLHTFIQSDKVTPLSQTQIQTYYGSFGQGEVLSPKVLNYFIYDVVTTDINRLYSDLLVENGMFTGEAKSVFNKTFGKTNYADNKDLIAALIRTRTKYYDWHKKAKADYENATAEYEERKNNDIEPMFTIDGYEMTLSFVMNQDNSFTINMLENYAEFTLNCFNNLKVRFNAYNIEDAQIILQFIYSPFTPKFF